MRLLRPAEGVLSWPDLLDQSAERLTALGVRTTAPFDLDRFLGQLMQLRGGREIVLTPISVRADSATVCGYCLRLADWDHVFYTQSRSRLHRTHNAVHELSHLMLGHGSVAPLSSSYASSLAPPAVGPVGPVGPVGSVSAVGGDAEEQLSGWLGLAGAEYSERCEDEADAAAAILLGGWRDQPAPRTWVAHSMLRRGSARLADAYA